jgi:uncharacterized membrane protein
MAPIIKMLILILTRMLMLKLTLVRMILILITMMMAVREAPLVIFSGERHVPG